MDARFRLKHKRLAREIRRSKLSQNHWARKLGISRGHFSQLVSGKRPYPAIETRQKLLEGLSLTLEELFEPESADAVEAKERLVSLERKTIRIRVPTLRWNRASLQEFDPCRFLEGFLIDLRQSFRRLFRSPGFSLSVILMWTLGIGLASACFGLVNGLFLRQLPFPDAGRLLVLWQKFTSEDQTGAEVSPANFLDWQRMSRQFDSMAAWYTTRVNLQLEDSPLQLVAARVTPGFFTTLGIPPQRGRVSVAQSPEVQGETRVVLSHRIWNTYFGSDPAVIGRSLQLNGMAHRVTGVMPPELDYPRAVDVWIPAPFPPEDAGARDFIFLNVIGRLSHRSTLHTARQEMAQIARELERRYPEANQNVGILVRKLREELAGPAESMLWILAGAVLLVLFTTCASTGNMLIARISRRKREVGIRVALGADPGRILTALGLEALWLSLAGCLAGTILAVFLTRFLVPLIPLRLPAYFSFDPDPRVLAFTLLLSLVAAALVFLGPGLWLAQGNFQSALRSRGNLTDESPNEWGRRLLITTQVAISLTALVGAGLFFRSFEQLRSLDPGYQAGPVWATPLRVSSDARPDSTRVVEFFQEMRAELEGAPEIEQVAAVSTVPLAGGELAFGYQKASDPPEKAGVPAASTDIATPNYFRTLGIPLLEGREFSREDRASTRPVVIVSQALVQELWPAEPALGKRLRIYLGGVNDREATVVGIARDIHHWSLSKSVEPRIYLPHSQFAARNLWLIARTRIPERSPRQEIEAALSRLDPQQGVSTLVRLEDLRQDQLRTPRLLSFCLLALSGIVLFLAVAGLYALLSWTVTQKQQDIGVRMALGAGRSRVIRHFLSFGVRMTVIGIIAGSLLTIVGARLVSQELFQVSPFDPLTYGVAIAVLVLTGLLASYLPARRASSVDPLLTIRGDV